MAGGTPKHAALTLAIAGALLAKLRGGRCRAFSSDLRVLVAETGLTTHPDVTVVYGSLETDARSQISVTNPKLLVEVLSPSTESYDLGEKFEHYRRIPSLRAVLYAWQDQMRLELRVRAEDGTWSTSTFREGETVAIDAIAANLSVDEMYGDSRLTD